MGVASLSLLGDTGSQDISVSSSMSPEQSTGTVLQMYPLRPDNKITLVGLNQLERETSVIRGEAALLCEFKDKNLECCWETMLVY